jgi:hypothetical protein
MNGSGAPNKILTYGYVKPRIQWFPNEEDPRPNPLGSPGGSGTIPLGYARTPSGEETLPSMTTPRPPLGGLGARLSPEAPDPCQYSGPALGSCPTNYAN